jgi:hypothetical protein
MPKIDQFFKLFLLETKNLTIFCTVLIKMGTDSVQGLVPTDFSLVAEVLTHIEQVVQLLSPRQLFLRKVCWQSYRILSEKVNIQFKPSTVKPGACNFIS